MPLRSRAVEVRAPGEIARVLRPGGRIRVSDIVAEGLPAWATADPELVGACIGGAIPEVEYVAGLERAGLVDVRVEERLRAGRRLTTSRVAR